MNNVLIVHYCKLQENYCPERELDLWEWKHWTLIRGLYAGQNIEYIHRWGECWQEWTVNYRILYKMHPVVGWQKANNVKNRFFLYLNYIYLCVFNYIIYMIRSILLFILYIIFHYFIRNLLSEISKFFYSVILFFTSFVFSFRNANTVSKSDVMKWYLL